VNGLAVACCGGCAARYPKPHAFFEREFLKLAGTMLACRFKVMGGSIEDDTHGEDIRFALLGMSDYAGEMQLLCKEARS
jgi:hypothetical protein